MYIKALWPSAKKNNANYLVYSNRPSATQSMTGSDTNTSTFYVDMLAVAWTATSHPPTRYFRRSGGLIILAAFALLLGLLGSWFVLGLVC